MEAIMPHDTSIDRFALLETPMGSRVEGVW